MANQNLSMPANCQVLTVIQVAFFMIMIVLFLQYIGDKIKFHHL